MNKILIANRGEVALRIARSCKRLGIHTVAVYSDADRDAPHVHNTDQAIHIGPAEVEHSYNNIEAVLAAALASGADGVHPGYGFLAENPIFASAVIAAGLTWIGPTPSSMEKMARKIGARNIARQHNIPIVAGISLAAKDPVNCEKIARDLGFPLLIKASAGGGGIGMQVVTKQEELLAAVKAVRNQSIRQFGNDDLLVEKFIERGRHIEVQVVGDQHGKLLHFLERDCSTQRRRQKLLEEAPAPGLPDELRNSLYEAALRLARAVEYQGVGTVEFVLDGDEFYLLEMNTRLQVEHPVTEAICGVDLVELQIEIARGANLALEQSDIRARGHAIEARVYAEDPAAGFVPATGTVSAFSPASDTYAQGHRIDSGVSAGSQIGHHYDGMLCKLIAHAENRELATSKLKSALSQLRVAGVQTNQHLLRAVLCSSAWGLGLSTNTLETELAGFLAAARPTSAACNLVLAAATIWQFVNHPPAADRRPWPGGYHQKRISSWRLGGQLHQPSWVWTSENEFSFPDLGLTATLLDSTPDTGGLVLEVDHQRLEFEIVGELDKLWIWQRELGNLTLERVYANSQSSGDQQNGRCTSLGPGQVLRVLVGEGQRVAAGDGLVVIESMKMESTLVAPCSGQVAAVAVSQGDLIESRQLLIQLDSTEENDS